MAASNVPLPKVGWHVMIDAERTGELSGADRAVHAGDSGALSDPDGEASRTGCTDRSPALGHVYTAPIDRDPKPVRDRGRAPVGCNSDRGSAIATGCQGLAISSGNGEHVTSGAANSTGRAPIVSPDCR